MFWRPGPHILNLLVEYQSDALDGTFQALADPTRRAILERLSLGEASVGELAEPFQISLAAVSKHIRVLERAGLIQRRVEGRSHHCRLSAEPLREVADWSARYREFWEQNLELLDALIRNKPKQRGKR